MKKKYMLAALAFGLSLSAKVMAQVPSYVPTNGLVGWWPFNGDSNDESGNGNNGTVNGTVNLTSDRFGNNSSCYDFQNGSINITHNSNLGFPVNSGFSVSLWAYKTGMQTTMHFIGKRPFSSFEFNWQIAYSNNGVSFGTGLGFNLYFGSFTNNSIQNNVWKNIIAVYNNETWSIYEDGILLASNSNITPFNDFLCDLIIGNSGNFEPFFGKLDDVGIWNRALTQQEITDLYNANDCSNDLSIAPFVNNQNLGGNVTLSANTSDANATFLWQSDFGQGFQILNDYGNYSGSNTNALSISNLQLANHNQPIRAISTSGNCIDTSNIATIQITDTCITNLTVYDTLYTTVTDTLIINTTLGLPAPNNENTILIYPNPASDHITIDNGNYTAMDGYSIKITNNAGQQVFQSAINQAQFYVDLSTWSGDGLYFVHLLDAQNNTVTVRKILLQ